MSDKKKLKICFIGANQAGLIGALTILSKGHEILSAVSYSEDVCAIFNCIGKLVHKSIEDERFTRDLRNSDLLFSVHGKEIVRKELLSLPRFGGINVHPYLYKYKGAKPVLRALREKEFRASVGAHVMEEFVDKGEVLVEEFTDVSGASSEIEIYNKLYPFYSSVILKVLEIYNDRVQ